MYVRLFSSVLYNWYSMKKRKEHIQRYYVREYIDETSCKHISQKSFTSWDDARDELTKLEKQKRYAALFRETSDPKHPKMLAENYVQRKKRGWKKE